MVGYARLIEQDEAGALARLKALRQDVIEPILAGHGGRIVKLMGDGALVEFPSASGAVQAAVEVQQAVLRHEQEQGSAGDRIRFRIGISLGDVVHEAVDLVDHHDIDPAGLDVCKQAPQLGPLQRGTGDAAVNPR